MRDADCPSLIEDILSETIPMHGRMIHARSKLGELYEESQQYDVYGRVSILLFEKSYILKLIFYQGHPSCGPRRSEQETP